MEGPVTVNPSGHAAKGLVVICAALAPCACGHGLAVGGGIGRASFDISNESVTRRTPVLSVRAFAPDSGKAGGGLLSIDLQPLTLHNPLRDETVTPLYILPQLQVGGPRACFRVGIGPSVHFWGGHDPAAGVQIVPSVGASLSLELARIAGRSTAIEASYRGATTIGEDAVGTTLMGVGLLVQLRQAPPRRVSPERGGP